MVVGTKTDLRHVSWKRELVTFVVTLVQLLVFAAILFPLAALYLFGWWIITGISLWRLIENDYYGGNAADGNAANLKPALIVLYSLALFQGVLFCYSYGASCAGRRLVDRVVQQYGFTELERKSVENYLRDTKIECEKDPSFARGRNLITYALGLMKPESSSHGYVSGARILDTLLAKQEWGPWGWWAVWWGAGHHKLIKQLLIGSASSSHVLQKLLQALDSRRPYDGEIRKLAARIVAHLAGDIRLEQFPRGIHSISSLLEASQQQDDDSAPSSDYKELMVQGLLILEKLPMATESRESFIKLLLGVFADVKEGSDIDIRGLAGEKLAALSLKSKSDAVIVLQANGDVVRNLTKILLEDKSNKCRISAAGILKGLCLHCTDDVECVKNMNKTMTDAMPKVLEAIFCCGLTGQKIKTGTEAHTVKFSSTVADMEEGQDGITSSPQTIEQPEDMVHELQEAFLSLITTILDNLVSADQDLAHPFVGDLAFSFAGKLKEMVEGNRQPTVKCLRTMKLTSKIAISMVTHGGRYVKVQDLESIVESLSKASKDMSDLDGVMFISSGNHGATNSARTLASLVKEARDLLGEKKARELAVESSN